MDAFIGTLLVDDLYTGGNAIHKATPITDLKATYDLALESFRLTSDAKEPSSFSKSRIMDQVATFKCKLKQQAVVIDSP